MVMAVAVVLGQMLPEAIASVGVGALLVFAAGFAAPRIAERIALALRRPACAHDDAMCTDLGLELGYVGLLLHHVGDGIGLGLYAGPLHEGHGHYDVLAALAGHTIPLTALMVLAFCTHRGALNAALRAAGIAATTLLGVLLAGLLSSRQLSLWEPWLTALVGGLLLHVVAHGWPAEMRPTRASRLLDFAALAVGVAVLTLGGHSHADEHEVSDVRGGMATALLALGLRAAPSLLLGIGVAAAVHTWFARSPIRWRAEGGALARAMRGAVVAASRPLWSYQALAVIGARGPRNTDRTTTLAFVIGASSIGIEAVFVSARFLGWPFALLRVSCAAAGAVLVGTLAARVRTGGSTPSPAPCSASAAEAGTRTDAPPPDGFLRRLLSSCDELLYWLGARILLGLLAAAYLQAALADGVLRPLAANGLDVVLVSLLAIPASIHPASATPLAAVLLGKGLSPGAMLAGLVVGSAINLASIAWLRGTLGSRATLVAISVLLVTSSTFAAIGNQVLDWRAAEMLGVAQAQAHDGLAYACAVLLALLIATGVWRRGLRGWLGSLSQHAAPGDGRHAHPHSPVQAHPDEGYLRISHPGLEHDPRLVAAVGVGPELHDGMQRKR
jgi:uncharacterized protein